ncbi:MAG: tRNA (adenosine(37)-N6)-threonylcarbamoyltransferase complex dimerization subunit type 1 TsaB [Salinibacterium sp.]|nr:MAG: tRNA (adenosine(37)-N6)-threonylcarbamoyltransferase complex dimerization subunit type 1 TsaB [Salinibacterium sp.]
MLLAIDTSAGTSVAIVDGGRVLARCDSDDPRRHAEVIGELIAACLDEARIAVTSLDGVVAGMGPGPFTGLRVGIAAARAFAVGAGLPIIPAVSHEAIAFEALEARDRPVIVATDARRQEVYWSAYSGLDDRGLPTRRHAPSLTKVAELEHLVSGFDGYELVQTRTVSAAALGLVAELQRASGRAPAANEPLYLRSPDVTLSAGPKRVTG